MSYNEGYLETHPALNPIFFRSWSPKTVKSRVVCLHGTGGTSADFDRFGKSMLSGTSEVLAVDLPGAGYSLFQTKIPAGRQMAAQVAFLKHLLTQDSLPTALVCSSGRSILGFWYAYQNREDEKASSMPIVFLEPAFGFDASTKAYIESCMTFFNQSYRTLDDAVVAWNSCDLRTIRFDSEIDKRSFINNYLRPDGHVMRTHGADVRKAQILNTRNFDVLDNKDSIRNPVLVVYGSETDTAKKQHTAIDRVFTNNTSRTIRGSGHPLTLYRESEIAEVKRFLKANRVG